MNGNKIDKPRPIYLSYLLRLRQVDNAGQPVWRVSLEAPGSETQKYFENLETIFNQQDTAYFVGGYQSPG